MLLLPFHHLTHFIMHCCDVGFQVSTLHGELQAQDRDRVMEEFRSGRSKVLITTNALARGVDVPAVAVVVNYDLPVLKVGQRIASSPETYLHRIGRCGEYLYLIGKKRLLIFFLWDRTCLSGRFGRRGTAISFLEKPLDFKLMEEIEKTYSPKKRMTTEWDPMDISGLQIAIEERPEGGEILPSAVTSSEGPSTISITVIGDEA